MPRRSKTVLARLRHLIIINVPGNSEIGAARFGCPQTKALTEVLTGPSFRDRGANSLTVAIGVVERHSRRARSQQHLLQWGGRDVVRVQQAGAMAPGPEGYICGAEKR